MELFTLTNSAPRIRKIVINRSAQEDLEYNANDQMADFLGYEECHELEAQYKPDTHEIFKIEDFEDIDGIINAVKDPAGINAWAPESEDLLEIKAFFFCIEHDDDICVGFQTFDRRQVLSQKFTLLFARDSFINVKGVAFSLDSKLTAVIQKNNKEESLNLLFRNLHNTRRIFDMDIYFKEATAEDVDKFFNEEKFVGYDNKQRNDGGIIDDWCRKKISYILNEGNVKDLSPDILKQKALELDVTIEFSKDEDGNEKIKFPTERTELKNLLRFLDEDIYKSSLTDTLYVANSKRKG
ncbi:hypothetical protein [Zymobacter sp. IVIA_12111.31 C1]|uniref:hypothetical protein n=1 Tax=Zymobacter sp. IVIA_12111.31 C1 TaxID=3394854 RepID=UPI0039C49FE3